MKWVRSNIGVGSHCAILALAIQFLWSFGHFHEGLLRARSGSLDGMRSGVHEPFDAPATQTSDIAGHAAAFGQFPLETSPGHLPPGQQHIDDCAICIVMASANAMTLAPEPEMPSPQGRTSLCLACETGFINANSARLPFQPRAPPTA